MSETAKSLCEQENKFKTGTDVQVELTLDIDGEVVSALPQIVVLFYYENQGRKEYFSLWAVDTEATRVVAFGTANDLEVRQITVASEVIEIEIPQEDTEDIVLNGCTQVDVKAEISFVDSAGKVQEVLDCENCDTFIGVMVKSQAEKTV